MEILVALAILGIIFAVALPMITTQREKAVKKTLFRETLLMLTVIQREGMLSGDMTSENWGAYTLSRVNALQTCSTDSNAQGCWDTAIQKAYYTAAFEPGYSTQPGFIMPNGVRVSGFEDLACNPGDQWYDSCANGFMIDYNGLKGPNTIGDDQLWLYSCYGSLDCTPSSAATPYPSFPTMTTVKVGAIGLMKPSLFGVAVAADDTANLDLYNWVYQ